MDELISKFSEQNSEDEVLKIAGMWRRSRR